MPEDRNANDLNPQYITRQDPMPGDQIRDREGLQLLRCSPAGEMRTHHHSFRFPGIQKCECFFCADVHSRSMPRECQEPKCYLFLTFGRRFTVAKANSALEVT